MAAIPDCAERIHNTAVYLQEIEHQGEQDFRMLLNIEGGTVYTALTASKANVGVIWA